MSYYINDQKITLEMLKKRILDTDLVPSRESLRDGIEDKFGKLGNYGYKTLADIRNALKNSKNVNLVAEETGIDQDYLVLLRRETGSYFPKPVQLESFNWLSLEDITKLINMGYKNSLLLYNALHSKESIAGIQAAFGRDSSTLNELERLVTLTRIQWVSALTARILLSAGYSDINSVIKAEAGKMCEKFNQINEQNSYYKGKIGLRDIKRLINAASYLKIR